MQPSRRDTRAARSPPPPRYKLRPRFPTSTPDRKEKVWEEWLGFPAMRMVDGRFPLSDKPGLGIEISEDARKKYPFQGTRLMPRLFHEDGSVAEW